MDNLSPELRSKQMGLVRSKDTKPEKFVRSLIHNMGYRFRLHAKDLPGKPDIIFRKRKKVIFIHGCFWHRHSDESCRLARMPKSKTEFWKSKLEGNRQRDIANEKSLKDKGWKILVLWECEIKNSMTVIEKIKSFLEYEIY